MQGFQDENIRIEADGPDDALHALLSAPGGDGLHQRIRDLRIVDKIHAGDADGAHAPNLVGLMADDAADAADDFAIPLGQEKAHFAVFEGRVLLWVQVCQLVGKQRGDILRGIPVELVLKADKPLAVFAARYSTGYNSVSRSWSS